MPRPTFWRNKPSQGALVFFEIFCEGAFFFFCPESWFFPSLAGGVSAFAGWLVINV